MTVIVSISELRNNFASYLDKVVKGTRVVIRDKKKGASIAQITHTSSFDKNGYEKTLRKSAGILSDKNHPEWRTKTNVSQWVEKSRLSDERKF